MSNFSIEEYTQSKVEIGKVIKNCEKILPKFQLGSSQHTLLINRINALSIGLTLVEMKLSHSNLKIMYSKEEIIHAIKPIESIIHKCKKAQSKFELNSKQYNRYSPLINSMLVCKTLMEEQYHSISQSSNVFK